MILLAECSNGDAQDGMQGRNWRLKEPVPWLRDQNPSATFQRHNNTLNGCWGLFSLLLRVVQLITHHLLIQQDEGRKHDNADCGK